MPEASGAGSRRRQDAHESAGRKMWCRSDPRSRRGGERVQRWSVSTWVCKLRARPLMCSLALIGKRGAQAGMLESMLRASGSSCRRQRFRSAALVGGYSDDITSYLSPCQIESVFIMAMEDGRENLGVKKHGWQLFRSLCLWLPLWLVAPN
eukprot:1150457-Pelagomonas_calceolata.AAC.1